MGDFVHLTLKFEREGDIGNSFQGQSADPDPTVRGFSGANTMVWMFDWEGQLLVDGTQLLEK